MTARNHPCFPPQFLHLHKEDHMALDELISNRRRAPFLPYVEGNLDVLLCDDIGPHIIAVFLVQRQILINRLRKLKPEIHACLCIFLRTVFPEFSDNSIPLPQHVLQPPVECRLVINLFHHRVLRCLDQVALFQVSQHFPGCALVFPDNKNLLASRKPFLAGYSIHRYLLILQRHFPF